MALNELHPQARRGEGEALNCWAAVANMVLHTSPRPYLLYMVINGDISNCPGSAHFKNEVNASGIGYLWLKMWPKV